MPEIKIKLSAPDIGEGEIAAVNEVMRSGWLSLGPKVVEFEQAFASYLGCKHAVACNSGTSALHMMMLTQGIGPGDEVITPSFSFIASANCIEMVGAKPVFVDIDPISLNMNPRKIADAVTENTKAILMVHIFGLSAESADICDAADSFGEIPVLEDACESLGATAYGKKVGDGTSGRAAAWGFYPNKQMTTGEGGMVTTNDDDFALNIKRLRNQGRNPESTWLNHDVLGYNFRLDEMSAAMGTVQINRFDELMAKREEVAMHYNSRLRPLKDSLILPMELAGFTRSWFVYPLVLRQGWDRDKLFNELAEKGIQCGKYFSPPIHLQTFYKEKYGYKPGDFPITEGISNQAISLPFHGNLDAGEVDYVCDAIEELIKNSPDKIRQG